LLWHCSRQINNLIHCPWYQFLALGRIVEGTTAYFSTERQVNELRGTLGSPFGDSTHSVLSFFRVFRQQGGEQYLKDGATGD